MIRLETSKRTGIPNKQVGEISPVEMNINKTIPRRFPNIVQRTEMSPLYNCHGLTFASRRTRLTDGPSVRRILSDDEWKEVEVSDLLAGDIVIYYSEDGDPNHSGIFAYFDALKVPVICSKWGTAGEFVHQLNDIPGEVYGPTTKFYRCQL